MTSTEHRPTRRTVVRGAAWSVPVVSLAAAAPAFAASSTSSLTGSIAMKWGTGQDKHVSWDLALANGPVAIASISITLTYTPNGSGSFNTFVMNSYGSTSGAWGHNTPTTTTPYTVTASRTISVAAGATIYGHVDFSGGENSAGTVGASATITYVDGSTSTATAASTWIPGSEHVH